MFELSVALKYLTPRWRQLSVSIISMISILVIALVVWLIVVFFSVTHGLEKSWIQKLIALTAPVRVTPTQAYYNSYYYKIDSLSAASDYNLKTIGEKLKANRANPHDINSDEEIPPNWPKPDLLPNGDLKDLVAVAFHEIQGLKGFPGLHARDYEMTVSNLRLRLLRTKADEQSASYKIFPARTQAFLNQSAYLGSLDPNNPTLSKALIKYSPADLSNLLEMVSIASDNIQEDAPDSIHNLNADAVRKYLRTFFAGVKIEKLKTPGRGWLIPHTLLPSSGKLKVCALCQGERIAKILIPVNEADINSLKGISTQHIQGRIGVLEFQSEGIHLELDGEKKDILPYVPLQLADEITFSADLNKSSIDKALTADDLRFHVKFPIQGLEMEGLIPYRNLQIAKAQVETLFPENSESPLWFYNRAGLFTLPADETIGEGVLLPKTFRDAGILLGDRGYLSFYAPTTSSVQEQRIPVFVAGFYDPGIIPIGGKFILANQSVTGLIRASHNQEDSALSNGINVRLDDISQAEEVKEKLKKAFAEAGIAPYWKIETYREYEFTRDIIQQLHSDRTLFTLISTVIIIVACSNIISMLIILVNDKKVEIGILRSMGATSTSIAAIFGICGIVMGVLGSLIGTIAAVLTLNNLDLLVRFLSAIQGYNAFNPVFYGETLPNEVSFDALLFVIAATAGISLLAGIVPAVKACLMRPSMILRSE